MSPTSPTQWLAKKAKAGVVDLPSNTAWLLSRALGEPANGASSSVGAEARKAKDAVTAAMPFGAGTLETRLTSASTAVEQARQAEAEAVAEAQRAKDAAEQAKAAVQDARRRRAEAKRELDDEVKQRVAAARQRADEMVAHERAEAETDAERDLEKIQVGLDAEVSQYQSKAEKARAQAEKRIEAAEVQMVEARQRADDAVAAAQEAAEQARQEADALAASAVRRADGKEDKVAAAEQIQQQVTTETSRLVVEIESDVPVGNLTERTKQELLEIAASLDVAHRSGMRKDQLVKAIRKAAKSAA